MVILTILILPICVQEYVSICAIFNFFDKFLMFSGYMSFTSLIRFILRYFFFFNLIVNCIIFLISTWDGLLLVYGKPAYFYILILFHEKLLDLIISSAGFLVLS